MITTDDGVLAVAADGSLTLVFERRLPAPPPRVWRAVTDAAELQAWFPCRVEGERVEGGALRFLFDDGSSQDGRVVAWSPPTSWSFEWGGERFDVTVDADGDGSLLRFVQHLPDRSGAARQGAGWHTCLDSLAAHLDGTPPAPVDFPARYASYLERMGPSPATVIARPPTLRWERTHHVPASRVWRAITDAGELSSWMQHGITISALALGGIVTFDFGPAHGTTTSVIVVLDEGRRFAFTFGDTSVAEWTVEDAPNGCRYSLTYHGGDADSAGGWHHHLVTLDMFLASGRVMAQDPARSHDLYRDL